MENRVFFNRYRLSLGRNGLPVELHRTPNGITYRGHEIDSGREVAIELVPWSQPDSATSEEIERAAAAAKKINHINIPVLHDSGVENDQLVYVTELLDGHTAEAWVAAQGPLPTGAVLRIALQVVGALGAANFHRIHHTAINPANIIFVPGQTADGDWPAIKVLHWLGPKRAPAEGADARADAAARFASPEQLAGGEVDFASAIFSLGCTMWFLLTGTPPAEPGATGVRAGVAKLRGVPKIVRHLLGRMLRVNPAERPRDPVVLQAYLQTCLARVERRENVSRRLGVPLAAPVRAKEPRAARNWPRKPLALAALLLLCGTLAVVALPRVFRSRKATSGNILAQKAVLPPQTAAPVTTPLAVSQAAPAATIIVPLDSNVEAAAPAEAPDEMTAPATESEIHSLAVAAESSSAPAQPTPAPTAVAVARLETPVPATPAAAPAETPPPSSAVEIATAESSSALPPQEIAAPEAPPMAADSAGVTEEPPQSAPAEIAAAAVEPNEITARETMGNMPPNAGEIDASATAPEPAATPHARKLAVAPKPSPRKKRAPGSVTVAKKSSARSRKKSRIAHAQVRRGRKIPSLHVGSNQAELVGTTSDGRWILSVASSGERIVVPPPPGYSP